MQHKKTISRYINVRVDYIMFLYIIFNPTGATGQTGATGATGAIPAVSDFSTNNHANVFSAYLRLTDASGATTARSVFSNCGCDPTTATSNTASCGCTGSGIVSGTHAMTCAFFNAVPSSQTDAWTSSTESQLYLPGGQAIPASCGIVSDVIDNNTTVKNRFVINSGGVYEIGFKVGISGTLDVSPAALCTQ